MPHSLGELGAMLFGFTLLFFCFIVPLIAAFDTKTPKDKDIPRQ